MIFAGPSPNVSIVFTISAVLWARVELQACRYTPWFSKQDKCGWREKTATNVNKLDYTEMLLPAVLFRSVRNGDFLVFVSTITSILLKVQIVLSSSIFYSNLVPRSEDVTVQIRDSFSKTVNTTNDGSRVNPADYLNALMTFDMPLHFGLGLNGSYKLFSVATEEEEAQSGLGFGEKLTVTVDFLSAEAQCLLLSNWIVSKNSSAGEHAENRLNVDFRFDECDEPVQVPFRLTEEDEGRRYHLQGLDKTRVRCSGLPSNQHFLYGWVNVTTNGRDNSSEPQVENCSAVVCSSSMSVSPTRIIDNGVFQNVSEPPLERQRFDVDPWDVITQFSAYRFWEEGDASASEGNMFTSRSSGFGGNFIFNSKSEWNDNQYLQGLVEHFVRQFVPIAVHFQMRTDDQSETVGTRDFTVARLHVQSGVTYSMAAISTLCAGFAVYATLHSRSDTQYYSRDPATLLGSMLVLRKQHNDLRQTSGTLEENHAGIWKRSWSKPAASPLVLSFGLRIGLVCYDFVLKAALLSTLRISQTRNGLAHFDDGNNYAPLAWQILPTAMLLLVTLYSTSSDFAIRNIALLSDLSTKARRSSEIDISLLDTLGGKALFRAISLAVPAVVVSQSLASLCGFLPILGSMLLIPEATPEIVNIQIPERDWFGTFLIEGIHSGYSSQMRRLFPMSNFANFTSAPDTYSDLLFPKIFAHDLEWEQGDSLQLTLTAARIAGDCQPLSTEQYYLSNAMITERSSDIVSTLYQTFTCPNGEERSINVTLGDSRTENDRDNIYVGNSIVSPANPLISHRECSQEDFDSGGIPPWLVQTYVWGEVPHPYESFSSLSVWECNYTWVEVEADVEYYWGLVAVLNQTVPPRIRYTGHAPRLYEPPFTVPMMEGTIPMMGSVPTREDTVPMMEDEFVLEDVSQEQRVTLGLDEQFSRIVEPFGSLSLDALGDTTRDEEVLKALHSLFAFAAAQVASTYQRMSYADKSDVYPFEKAYKDRRVFNGTLSRNTRQTIVQEADITYVTITILSIFVVVHSWAIISELWHRFFGRSTLRPWLLDLELKGVAPPECNSLVLIESLLEGSNYNRVLPENAHLMPSIELHEHLQGKRFQLGWFHNLETGEDIYTIGVLNEGNMVYKGNSAADGWRSVGETPGLMLDYLRSR